MLWRNVLQVAPDPLHSNAEADACSVVHQAKPSSVNSVQIFNAIEPDIPAYVLGRYLCTVPDDFDRGRNHCFNYDLSGPAHLTTPALFTAVIAAAAGVLPKMIHL